MFKKLYGAFSWNECNKFGYMDLGDVEWKPQKKFCGSKFMSIQVYENIFHP